MEYVIQTRLAKELNTNESNVRKIVGYALNFDPNFITHTESNVLVPENSVKIIKDILEFKKSTGVTYKTATKFYYDIRGADTECKKCKQLEKEIERKNRLLRLTNKSF